MTINVTDLQNWLSGKTGTLGMDVDGLTLRTADLSNSILIGELPPPLPPPPPGTLIAEAYLDCEAGVTDDLLTAIILNAATHGLGSWYVPTISALRVRSGNLGPLLQPVGVDGIAYNGAGSRSIAFNHAVSANEFIRYNLPSPKSLYKLRATIVPGPVGTWGFYDLITVGAWPNVGVIQYKDSPGGPVIQAHTSISSGSFVGPTIAVTAGVKYIVECVYDSPNLLFSVKVFNVVNGVQIGSTSSCRLDNVTTNRVSIGCNAHGVLTPALTLFDDIMFGVA